MVGFHAPDAYLARTRSPGTEQAERPVPSASGRSEAVGGYTSRWKGRIYCHCGMSAPTLTYTLREKAGWRVLAQ